MGKKLIAANWKENPSNESTAAKLFAATAKVGRGGVEVAVCPPFVYIDKISAAYKKLTNKKDFALGAQDTFWEEEGPYTGEVGPKMLKAFGLKYVIVGHSERRKWLNETDVMINKKLILALKDGLTPILCVGEALPVRRKGVAAARTFVKDQLKKDLAGVRNLKPKPGTIVVAYEPIWAIGTGRYDEAEDAATMASFIKSTAKKLYGLTVRVLYGGSVNAGNIADYVQYKSIDGALVGGASLKAEEFKKIITITSKQ